MKSSSTQKSQLLIKKESFCKNEHLNFSAINLRAKKFAEHLERNFDLITNALLHYESFEVVEDEFRRTLDLFNSLKENKKFFRLRIGEVTSFLPRNQPLYAFSCFVLIPSLMAKSVHFRIPYSMRHFFINLLKSTNAKAFFPNIFFSNQTRIGFLEERSALYFNSTTKESFPLTEAVIFTGSSHHSEQLRFIFDKRTLFIANGAGHNPIVVSQDADILKAVQATVALQTYNQGQDCAAPNSILVHKKIFSSFLKLLHEEIRKIRVGHYLDRSCRIGPISEPEDLVRIQNLLVENKRWIDPSTPGTIRSRDAIVEPTIITKPLKYGGNYLEVFCPIIFLQRFDNDNELSSYFENENYARNAMYISLFGSNDYIDSLEKKIINGKILHDSKCILRNIHLHMPGVERGTQPYGGYGYGASSISINGKIMPKPTLPQRDIYEWLVKPILNTKAKVRKTVKDCKLIKKDIKKLLGIKNEADAQEKTSSGVCYIDSHAIKGEGKRYIKVETAFTFQLLEQPNKRYIESLEPKDIILLKKLTNFLAQNPRIQLDKFANWLYKLPLPPRIKQNEIIPCQAKFFIKIYNLLFGKGYGPRLPRFLLEADHQQIRKLLLDI